MGKKAKKKAEEKLWNKYPTIMYVHKQEGGGEFFNANSSDAKLLDDSGESKIVIGMYVLKGVRQVRKTITTEPIPGEPDLRRKRDQEWDMAGLARQDGDLAAMRKHTEKAKDYQKQLSELFQ